MSSNTNQQLLDDLLNGLNGAASSSTSATTGYSASVGYSASAGNADFEQTWASMTGSGYGSTNGVAYNSSMVQDVSMTRTAGGAANFASELEQRILRSDLPVEVNETEELTVLGHRGLWVNKNEVVSWRGDVDISEYKIYEDRNPEVINKTVNQEVEYVQELAIRYLRPPTPEAAGDIVITQEANFHTGPAPPLIIRQAAARASTPEPLVIREAPPAPPALIGQKRITISGKRNPPPPRKVVIERLAALPAKPQNVIIERWLPYESKQKRRVVFNRATEVQAEVHDSHNVIVQWGAPKVNIRKEVKYLGVIRADPAEYIQRYRDTLTIHTQLPQFVMDIATPSEYGLLAANSEYKSAYELEGAIEALQLVDLEAHGLSEFRDQLLAAGFSLFGSSVSGSASEVSSAGNVAASTLVSSTMVSGSASGSASVSASASGLSAVAATAAQIFSIIDKDNSGAITIGEAESIVLKLNSKLSRSYGETEVHEFFTAAAGGDDKITLAEFIKVFENMSA